MNPMTPDGPLPGEKSFDPPYAASAAPASHPRLEFWLGADTAADNLLVLQSAGNGFAMIDPQHGWGQIRRFDSYEAAYSWLTREAYEPVDVR